MKKVLALLLVVVMSVAVCVSCNKPADSSEKTEINVCLASEPDTIDPALNSAVDGATLIAHLFSGLAKWAQDSKGNLVITPDAAKELVEGVANDDGTVTYTYTLRDGLKWSDGKDVTAGDFAFAWKRAASEELGAEDSRSRKRSPDTEVKNKQYLIDYGNGGHGYFTNLSHHYVVQKSHNVRKCILGDHR